MAREAQLRRRRIEDETQAEGFGELLFLIIGGAGLAAALWWLTGPPEVPSSPDWGHIREVLTSSEVPQDDLILVLSTIGWLILGYLGLSIALRLLVDVLSRLSDGATWAAAAVAATDFITLPFVRRTVDGALGGFLLLSVWLKATPAVDASGATPIAVAIAPSPHVKEVSLAPAVDREANGSAWPQGFVSYTVREGDSLWEIARRVYGDGAMYAVIFRANEGKVMTTGEPFTDPGKIRPGWVLEVPVPGQNVEVTDSLVTYKVRAGDSLWGIAEGFLGDGFRWTEIWDLNQGREMRDGRRFFNPDLLHPGWVLELPVQTTPSVVAPPIQPTPLLPSPVPSPAPAPTKSTQWGVAPVQTPAPVQQSPDRGGVRWPSLSPVLATAAGLAGTATVVLIVRQLARRQPTAAPGRSAQVHSKRATGDAGRVALAAKALANALTDLGFEDSKLLLAGEWERSLDFTIDCPPGDADALVRSRYDLGRRLACVVDAHTLTGTRVLLMLSRFQRLAGLLTGDGLAPRVLLVPVGAAGRAVHYLNLAAVGSVMLLGKEQETQPVLSAWLTTLAAVYQPDEVLFLPAAGATAQVGDLTALPHFSLARGRSEERSLDDLVNELQETIIARDGSAITEAATLALIGPSADLKANLGRLETVLHRGPERRIYALAMGEDIGHYPAPLGATIDFFRPRRGWVPDHSATEAGDLILNIGRDKPLIFHSIQVRAEVLRPPFRGEPDVEVDFPWDPCDDDPAIDTTGEDADVEPAGWEGMPDAEAPDGEVIEGKSADPVDFPPLSMDEESESQASGIGVSWAEAVDGHATRQPVLLLDEEGVEDGQAAGTRGPIFTVRCFGSFQVETAAGEVTGWTVQKARELLAYLIAHAGTPVLREQVADALWPQGMLGQVEHLLSNAAHYLRKAIRAAGPDGDVAFLMTSGQRYYLRRAIFRVDLDAFDAHLHRAETLQGAEALVEYERALAVYRGPVMGSEPYEWAESYRRQYQKRFLLAAHRAGQIAVECRDLTKAKEIYQEILAQDPLDEEAARRLMRCYANLGDVNGIRKVYKALAESLIRGLEDETAKPLPETKALYEELTGQ